MDSRRDFLFKLLGSASMLVMADFSQSLAVEKKPKRTLGKKEHHERANCIIPCGSDSFNNFHRHCIGCHLCVSSCPSRVLSVGLVNLHQPTMSFEQGYCRPDCTQCSQVCPTGAILPITQERKSHIQIGLAKWDKDLCRNSQGKHCKACSRFCPQEAIKLITSKNDPSKREIVIDPDRCVGCGACEYICPNRPKSAIYVDGFMKHKEKTVG